VFGDLRIIIMYFSYVVSSVILNFTPIKFRCGGQKKSSNQYQSNFKQQQ